MFSDWASIFSHGCSICMIIFASFSSFITSKQRYVFAPAQQTARRALPHSSPSLSLSHCCKVSQPVQIVTMAMRMAFRGSVSRPLLTTPRSSARPVLSWAARWKGSAAPAKIDADKKEEAEAAAPDDKPKPPATPAAELPVTFEVSLVS